MAIDEKLVGINNKSKDITVIIRKLLSSAGHFVFFAGHLIDQKACAGHLVNPAGRVRHI